MAMLEGFFFSMLHKSNIMFKGGDDDCGCSRLESLIPVYKHLAILAEALRSVEQLFME